MTAKILIIVGIILVIGMAATFLFFSNGSHNTCEQMGGTWNADHCVVTSDTFETNLLTCDPGTVLENGTCHSNGIKLVFKSSTESELDKRRIGWTPAFEYHRVQINGTVASQTCALLRITYAENPVFDAINRHDKNYTYFYHELSDMEYLVIIDDGQICYTADDVDFEYTGLFERCVEIKNED
jgi:hypothetical protein